MQFGLIMPNQNKKIKREHFKNAPYRVIQERSNITASFMKHPKFRE